MSKIIRAASILLGLAAFAGAAQAANNPLVVWNGAITITSRTAACDSIGGFGVGSSHSSVFRPRLVADEPNSGLTVFTSASAQVYFRTSGNDQMKGKGAYTAQRITSRATVTPNSTVPSFTGRYIFGVKPATITATTKFLTIVGTLTNFFAVNRCVVKFLGSYALRPN